jgi:hypothetical protein
MCFFEVFDFLIYLLISGVKNEKEMSRRREK